MAKDKTSSKKAAKAADTKVLDNVKAGRVTKAAENLKSSAKETAKAAAKNIDKESKSKKSKKVPTPEPESESEDETSDSSASSEEDSDSDSDSDVSEDNAAPAKTNGAKTNGAAADSDSDSSEDDSEDDSEDEAIAPAKVNGKANGKVNGTTKPAASDDDEDDSDDSSEDDSEDSDASDDSSEDDEDDEEDTKVEEPSKKRKAEEAATPSAKKTKVMVDGEAKDPSANLFCGNLSWNIDEEWLTREFEEFGTLNGVRIITDRDSGRSKGFGYVEFADVDDAIKALEAKNGSLLDGREIRIDFSQPRPERSGDDMTPRQRQDDRKKRFGDVANPPSKTLWVGNLSFDADESTISEVFQEYGGIKAVRLPTDRETGAPKGFGYVEMDSVEEATAAYEALQGADVTGRPIRLDYAGERSNDSPRGGFGGRGGRGGGRGGFGDRGGRGGRGGFGGRGGRGGGRGGSTNRGGFGDFSGRKTTF